LDDTVGMTIDELNALRNCQSVAVDNTTGHAIAIIRVKDGYYRLLDGNSMTTPQATEIPHPKGGNIFSIDEVRQMFVTRKLSGLRGFLPD
jgi:hypothetical protein